MSDIIPTIEEVKEVTTIWYKGQRVLRTALASFLTLLPIAPQIIAIVNEQWPTALLAAVGVQVVALNSVVTRIMTIPLVNAWLTKVGFGSVPRSAVKVIPSTGRVVVRADKKAADGTH